MGCLISLVLASIYSETEFHAVSNLAWIESYGKMLQ